MPLGLPAQVPATAAAQSTRVLLWLKPPGRPWHHANTASAKLSRREFERGHQLCVGPTFATTPQDSRSNSSAVVSAPCPSLPEEEQADSQPGPLLGKSHKTTRSTRWLLTGLSEGTVLRTPAQAANSLDLPWQYSHKQLSNLAFLTVAFYHLVDIEAPDQLVQQHALFLKSLDIRGRIYLSPQGINAQFSGPAEHAQAYTRWVAGQPLFQELRWNEDPVAEHMFPKLRLAAKRHLVQLAGGMTSLPITDAEARAREVPPQEWQRLLQAAADGSDVAAAAHNRPVILDVRNGYEWDAGHFDGAARPLEDNFVDTPTSTSAASGSELPAALHGADPATTPVMMYCTGGIRCDVYSTHLRRLGFRNLLTLQGGIQNYLKQTGSDHWRGSLFVFDGRMAVPAGDDGEGQLVAAAPCGLCGGPGHLPHSNCAHVDCNRLFISCPACAMRLQGCCSAECLQAPAHLRRPARAPGTYNLYDKLRRLMQPQGSDEMDSGDAAVPEALRARRGAGKTLKRQRRAERLKEQHQAVLAEREKRKAMARAVMAAHATGVPLLEATG